MGCGYEPPAPAGVAVMPWQVPAGTKFYPHDRAKVCAGYTTSLPEVIEASKGRAHWERGELRAFTDDERPTPELLDSILILEEACKAVELWCVTPADKGGAA